MKASFLFIALLSAALALTSHCAPAAKPKQPAPAARRTRSKAGAEPAEAAIAKANAAAAAAALANLHPKDNPNVNDGQEPPAKRQKRAAKPAPAKLAAKPPPSPPPPSGDERDYDSDSDYDAGEFSDPDADATTVDPAAAGPSTTQTSTAFARAVAPLKFKAQQFEDKGHSHLARSATEIAELHEPLAAALRDIGDTDARTTYNHAQSTKKLNDLAAAAEGALILLRDRNMDLAIRSAARDRGISEFEVLRTTRAQYGSLQDLDPELRVAMKDALKVVTSNSHKKQQPSDRLHGRPQPGNGPPRNRFNTNNNRAYKNNRFRFNRNTGRNSCNDKPFNNSYNNDRNDRNDGSGGFNPSSNRRNDYRGPKHGSSYENRGNSNQPQAS